VTKPRRKYGNGLTDTLRSIERELILEALVEYGWQVNATARSFGIEPGNFRRKLREHGIRRPARAPAEPDGSPA
jgi:DNA-binding NtrC family response regulator